MGCSLFGSSTCFGEVDNLLPCTGLSITLWDLASSAWEQSLTDACSL